MDFFESFEETSFLNAFFTYINYGVLALFGHLRDTMRRYGFEKINSAKEPALQVGKGLW